MSSDIDKAFEQLKREGKNNLENIMKWLKDAKVVNEKYTEEQAKKFFEGVDKNKVELEKFNEAMKNIAKEKKQDLTQIQKQLTDETNKVVGAVKAGVKAFQDNLKIN